MKLVVRDIPPRTLWALEKSGLHPLLAQLYAARGVQDAQEMDTALAHLMSPATIKGLTEAAQPLAHAIDREQKL